MNAIIKISGKQYKVSKGDILKIDRQNWKVGDKVKIDDVLLTENKGKVSIGNLGIIDIASKLGITISAIKETTLEGIVKAIVKGTLIDIIAQGIVKIEGAGIHLNGSTEPALLGNEFWKVFKDHQHSSSVGPTGGILPAYSMKQATTVSKKVFLG